jgi:hypothetical protein
VLDRLVDLPRHCVQETANALRLDGMEPVAMPEDKGERLLREFYKMYPDMARKNLKGA